MIQVLKFSFTKRWYCVYAGQFAFILLSFFCYLDKKIFNVITLFCVASVWLFLNEVFKNLNKTLQKIFMGSIS